MLKKPVSSQWSALANQPEIIMLPQSEKNKLKIFYLKNTGLAQYAHKNFPAKNIIQLKYLGTKKDWSPWSMDFSGLVKRSNFADLIKQHQITNLVLPYRSSKWLEAWAKKLKLNLATTPFDYQDNFENKSWFDRLLKRSGVLSPKTHYHLATINKVSKDIGFVLQQSSVSDSAKTHFFKSGHELASFVKSKKIDLKNYTIREYLPGVPVGVSIFINQEGDYFLSALRRQCFDYQNGFPQEFIGLQWLPNDFFNALELKSIASEINKLAKVLVKEKFIGTANADFILYENKAYVIECNPRLSAATPQMFCHPELSSAKNPWQFYLQTFLPQAAPFHPAKEHQLPRSKFCGSVLESAVANKYTVKKILPIGWYGYQNKKIKYLGPKRQESKQPSFFLFHELGRDMVLHQDYAFINIYSNFPLYDRHLGVINEDGLFIKNYMFNKFQ